MARQRFQVWRRTPLPAFTFGEALPSFRLVARRDHGSGVLAARQGSGRAMQARRQGRAAVAFGGTGTARRRWTLALLGLLAAATPLTPARAQERDWPCPQRLVPTLEGGQMWAGPPLPTDSEEGMPPDVAALAQELTNVDLPPETVAAKVQAYAAALPAEQRNAGLARLFAASLAVINAERSDMIGGIKRYTQRQQRLAERIAGETRELEALRRDASADPAKVGELEASRDWDLRVHSDRQRALRQVCDQPVRLEQRAFALARTIQEELP